MPVYHECIQGSPRWIELRLGIPTASAFDRILTPGGKISKQADGYARELLAEVITGKATQAPTLAVLQRGHDLEETAVNYYELQRDTETRPVGFVTSDDGTYGASPDRTVGEDGLLEIKCPLPATHIGYLLENGPDEAYWPQLQGQLMVTGRKWVDIVSYHPDMPMALVRVERSEEYIKKLRAVVVEFCVQVQRMKQILIDKRFWAPRPPAIVKPVDPAEYFDITDADVEMIFARSRA